MKKILATCAAVVCLTQHAAADPVEPYTGFVGFGDSWSDPGRFSAIGVPSTPPSNGSRFTDGLTWMEIVGNTFEANGQGNFNMALGGATAGTNSTSRLAEYALADAFITRDASDPNDIPFTNLADFDRQISSFLNAGFDSQVGSNPIVTILLGGNDFLQAGSTDPSIIANNVIAAISNGIIALAQSGAQFDNFLVANMPDFSIRPSLVGAPQLILDDLRQQSIDYNAALAVQMTSLTSTLAGQGLDVEIEILDLFTTTDNAYATAVSDGLIVDDVCTDALVGGIPSFNNCLLPGSSAQYLFMDDVHPGQHAHSAWADAALNQLQSQSMAPVPLPASFPLLLAGGLGLFALRRRRAA